MRPKSEHAITAALLLLTLVFVLLIPEESRAQERSSGETRGAQSPEPPEIEAGAWALSDAESGRYLAGENPDEPFPIGSVTKIMSALVVLEEGLDLEEEVTISGDAEGYVGDVYSNVGLIAGERITVRDLVSASLVASGSEAVYALAERTGDGSVENFVGMMNEKASELGLENTRFETPIGLDTAGNYASARDLAILTQEALGYPLFAETVDTQELTINTQNDAGDREIEIFNTNQLLDAYPPATGVKTGTTPEAGANIVASAESDDESFIAVVIGAESSEARYLASEAILEYGFGGYDREPLVTQGEGYEGLELPSRPDESVDLTAQEDVTALVNEDSEVERRVTVEEAPPSAETGEELGEVEVFVDGRIAGSSALVVAEGYEEASLLQRAWHLGRGLMNRIGSLATAVRLDATREIHLGP